MKPLNRLWNVFPQNPTETSYLRFWKTPSAEIKSAFSEFQLEWDKDTRDRLKTRYDELWRGDIT